MVVRTPSDNGPAVLRRAATATPDAVALLAPDRASVTYRGLAERVDRTAEALKGLGLGRGDRIAIVLPDGPEMAVAFLASTQVAAAAPLNPALTADEFAGALAGLGATALLLAAEADTPARSVAHGQGVAAIEVVPSPGNETGRFALRGDPLDRSPDADPPRPDDLALLLQTSGTTAWPKRIPLTHANVCTTAFDMTVALALGPADRLLAVMPMFHVQGLVGELLATLTAGASIVRTPGFDAPRFFGWLDAFSPTWFSAVPTMQRAIVDRVPTYRELIARRPLRFVRCSSASLSQALRDEIEAAFGAPVIDGYGMTETSILAMTPFPPAARKPGSAGISIGAEIRLSDEAGRVLPAGSEGEIQVRNANVVRGYDGDPEATAAAFTADGWFRTGDVGYLDRDGYLFVTGRLKELINRGGEKIAPRQIDEALLAHPAVAQALAFGVPDPRLGEEVAAAVILHPGSAVTEIDLRRFIAERLAEFKVPRRIVVVDALPTGPTGKLVRTGLAALLGHATEAKPAAPSGRTTTAPRTATERLVAGIWAEVLGLDPVGAEDDFLSLGGDSILATRIITRLAATLRLDLSVAVCFEAPTVAAMAAVVDQALLRPAAPLVQPVVGAT
jgi:acyl-CoA synthetase (AMP-forming)/AMP-acid ligase II